ncbi:YqiJ family protein [Qipengyuania sp.]|uniref:YqiJ family protein n=1 Tax=Qipengyuania sp. TaxID=2004515 RepID=UPI003510EFC4
MTLLEPHNMPFAAALAVMLILALLQVIGLGDFDVDADFDAEATVGDPTATGIGGAITSLLGLGRVPLFVWLIAFLLSFATIGMSIQALASDLTGSPLYVWLAAVIAGGASIPVTAMLARPIGAIMPKDETSAVGLDSLVGKRGTVTTGRAAKGSPARTRVYDRHGQAHHVMVEPHEDASEMLEGDEVLLVRREGQTFFAVPLAERKLSPLN